MYVPTTGYYCYVTAYFQTKQVFPGGNTDPEDGMSPALTAIRETFEESGLLLASHPDTPTSFSLGDQALNKARDAILRKENTFNQFLKENSLMPDVNSLHPFTQWITPVGPPRSVVITYLNTNA
jgi:8-oxo-dGTP pyrophosphatase MutT (NUDIX family)